jgi:hypothetical protein
VYSISEYEKATAPNGAFEAFGVEHEVVWDCRKKSEPEGENETIEIVTEAPKRGRKPNTQ